ncbi:hypothetical protein S40288_09286 [Stachybotrys chartarum IBT 40288]|nr:hypothetical protein S40288_09286 [Stachybotrys chartarum IBT 40288]
MVNVGGRSKGCSTCRKRRVKCDEQRPVCGRCRRCGLACQGPKDMAFIVVGAPKQIEGRPAEPISRPAKAVVHRAAVPASMPLRGMEAEMSICYVKHVLRHNGVLNTAMKDMKLVDITPAHATVPSGRLYHQSILTFATILFGTHHKQSEIVQEGYAIHGVALRKINHAIQNIHLYKRDEVILSVTTLALMEAAVPTASTTTCLRHMLGMQSLFPIPDVDTWSDDSYRFYKPLQHLILFASLRMRTPCVLAMPEWKACLRKHATGQDLEDYVLYNVLADCSVLMAEYDELRDGDALGHDEIENSALALLLTLYDWRTAWGFDGRNAYEEVQLSNFKSLQSVPWPLAEPSRLDTVFEFAQDPAASLIMLYNTALVHVLHLLATLSNSAAATSGASEDITQLNSSWDGAETSNIDYSAAAREAALEICRCMPHYLDRQPRLDTHFSPINIWCMSTAWRELRGEESPEGRWMAELLTKSGKVFVTRMAWSLEDATAKSSLD